MANRRSAWLITALFVLASLPAFAQWSTRPDPSSGNAPGPNYIPEGTRFIVKLDDTLDTKKLKVGKQFKAKLAEDLVAPNGSVIPAGKKIKAHVSDVDQGVHGRILISFDEIETRKGWRPLVASITDVPGEKGVKPVGSEGEIERKGRDKKRMIEAAAVGAAVGAGTGAIAGGGKGAVIGAAAGAGVGMITGLLTDRELKLNKGQQLELRLDRPLQVPQG
ncbi:MAG TPA: hypothetical protein VN577_12235 [Terriglobales bacterium]|nr:hypothetical protein [Terriglobales bacterium]